MYNSTTEFAKTAIYLPSNHIQNF